MLYNKFVLEYYFVSV